MENPMRKRIQARLNALGISAIEAARRVPSLNRYYIYDFMNGKKDSIPNKRIEEVAAALGCEVDYLLGAYESAPSPMKSLTLHGIIEPGAWRVKQPDYGSTLKVLPDTRFPSDSQRGFICRSDALTDLKMANGSIVVTTSALPPRPGDVVVIKERREGSNGVEHMISATRIFSTDEPAQLEKNGTKILGVVVQVISVF